MLKTVHFSAGALDVQKPFDLEVFRSELSEMLTEWKSKWTFLGTQICPRWIGHLDEETITRQEVEWAKPQQEVIDKVIDYVAALLLMAEKTGQAKEAYETIFECFGKTTETAASIYYEHILPAILLKVLKLSQPSSSETDVDRAITSTRDQAKGAR